ncbi:THUMP domain-containing class I SAM-dependent RNA methyltransferase [Marivivens aquimaris]|uniref:THUMP domain-containing class I SAM-dependent RNA methyltransferase n=1 Tax=Marivivens aquimaris TaxID=2774876 RepID=UPI001882B021|nr:class I SAM-dependent RNA methyltransferase [Marivivens aquimaris]
MKDTFEIFVSVAPGLEDVLCAEVAEAGFPSPQSVQGGVSFEGNWVDVYRANLELRGAARVLARIGEFRVMHLAQLDKRARKFPWGDVLRSDVPLKVDVTCRKSKIYHDKAARQRIETALKEDFGATIAEDAPVVLKVRIEDDLCSISVDTSGESLHKRGHKEAVGKAPMRENLAALFLRECGYTGSEPVVDPMCGSGTFVIEAAEIAMGLQPGRSREFAFQHFVNYDDAAFQKLKKAGGSTELRFFGSDRDAGAVRMSTQNAERAGVSGVAAFKNHAVSDLQRPEGAEGLVIVNPPYGARIGQRKLLYAVYGALGKTLIERFSGWRVGIITSDAALAHATGLPFMSEPISVSHGGLRVQLFRTEAL